MCAYFEQCYVAAADSTLVLLRLRLLSAFARTAPGARFKGVYNIYEHQLNLFTPNKQRVTEKVEVDIQSSELDERVGEREAAQLREELELVDGVYPKFEEETYRSAEVAPVFFGSALNNFGVQELLDCFVHIAPSPRPTQADGATGEA